jgi:predicted ribosomally synthesized peptide with SipW-like signal peptide
MKKKTLTIAIALVLVVALAVGATYAYLTAKTEAVTNTFTVGTVIENGKFVLKEHKVEYKQADGTYDYTMKDGAKEETESNTYSQLAPKMVVPKDPFISFRAEVKNPAYVFVEICNTTNGQIKYAVNSDWMLLDGVEGEHGGAVYAYKNTVVGSAIADLPILGGNTITVADTATTANLSGKTLTFYGYLCQATGFNTAADAFTNCFGTTGK